MEMSHNVRTKVAVANLACILGGVACAGRGWAKSAQPPWTWEFHLSRVPKFQERGKENQRLLVVEVEFKNNLTTEQNIVMEQGKFRASTKKGKPLEILGLLFSMKYAGGAQRMVYVGGIKHMETLYETEGGASSMLIDSPGPVEVYINPGKAYIQRILLTRPKGKKTLLLNYEGLPELEISPPR